MEKFSFSKFSIFYGVFATFWLSGTSSRTVNAAKSLDFTVKFYQTLSQTHEKTQKFQKPFFFMLLDRFLLASVAKSSDFAVFTVLELVPLNQKVAKTP